MTAEDKRSFEQQADSLKTSLALQRSVLLQADTSQNQALVEDAAVAAGPHTENEENEARPEAILGPEGTVLASGAFLGEWQVLLFLGGGTYGHVFEVVERLGGTRLAAKVAVAEDTLQDLDAERRLLGKFAHPNIVRSFGFAASSRHAALLLELAQTDLASWLELPCNKLVGRSMLQGRWRFLFQLVSALEYIHSHKTLHLDIKINNVLVFETSTGQNVLKFADFGLSQALLGDSLDVAANAAFTSHFRPPELLIAGSSRVKVSFSSDTYALGCCVYDIFRNSAASPLLFPSRSLVELMLLEKQRGGAPAAYSTFVKYRDERLDGISRRPNQRSRVQDSMAVRIVKETVAPPSSRVALKAMETCVRMRISVLCADKGQTLPPMTGGG
jgi:serine/threonine protein kinase